MYNCSIVANVVLVFLSCVLFLVIRHGEFGDEVERVLGGGLVPGFRSSAHTSFYSQ